MFKSSKWRGDKNKIKAVFKLQFHATQLSQLGGDALMISVIPADVGKPTAKLEKAKVRDGSCYWEKPHFETAKFVQDPKTGKIHEKIYHFVVATGSSKFGGVGEVSIDLASYAEATKLSSMSLPLKNANSAAVLHVLIQRMQDSVDQREVDESETASFGFQDRSLRAQFSNGDLDGSVKSNPTEDGSLNGAISHVSNLIGNCRASSLSDITLSSSDSSSGLDTPREPEIKNKTIQKPNHDSSTTIYEERQRSQWEWLESSAPELSTDDSSISPINTLLREISEESTSPENVIKKLKSELVVLARQADMSELELQTLRKQIVKESKRGQDLSKELVLVKEERNAFKEECEKLNAYQKKAEEIKVNNKLLIKGGDTDPWALLDEVREELNYEKGLNSNLRIQLQKTQESNSELILAVRDLDEMLEQKNMQISSKSAKVETDDDDDEEQKALEEIVKEHRGAKEAYLLEEKIMDLYGGIELYRRDKDEIEMQMEQIALDYEILKQENNDLSYKLEQSQIQEQLKMQYECSTSYATVNELENQIEKLENELNVRSKEFSDSLVMIKELETHVRNLEEELENQALGFEEDLEEVMHKKIEQEQRAIRAEETLRKTRLQNANTAEKLQEEFRRLSMQMASTFDANEKVAMKALNEASELRIEKSQLKEMLEKAKEDLDSLGDRYEAKLLELSDEIALKKTQIEKMEQLVEDQKRSGEETHEEIKALRAEIERLKAEKQILEIERMKMEKAVSLAKMEAESSMQDLENMRGVNDEKESVVAKLQSEIEILKAECNDLKHSLTEDELEREKLRKQIFQLKGDLKRKEDAFTIIEKKLKDREKTASRNNKSVPVPRSSKEVTNLKDKIKQFEGQIKLKEAALESSENSFLEKEKYLQNKIEELERRMEVINQSTTTMSGCELRKLSEEARNTAENSNPITKSNDAISPDIGDQGDAVSNEISLLKKKNMSMEGELKEIQERYSEISLKFAEVEGERQQLVMTLRNLKNAKKC